MNRNNRHNIILCCIFLVMVLLCVGGCANESTIEEGISLGNNYQIKQIPVSFPDDWGIVDIAANDETAFYMVSRRPASEQGLEMGQIQIEAIDLASLERKTVYTYTNDDVGFDVGEMQATRDHLFWVRLDVEDNKIYIEELDLSTGEAHVIKEYGTAIWDIALQTDGEYLTWLLISDEGSWVSLYDIEKRTAIEIPARPDFFCNRIRVTEGICSFTTEEGDQVVINVYDIEEQKTLHQIKLEPGTEPLSIAADADRCFYSCFVNGEMDGNVYLYDYDTKSAKVIVGPEKYNVFSWDYSNGRLFVNDRESGGIIVMDFDSSENTCLLEHNEQLFVLDKTTINGDYIALGEDSVPEGEGVPMPTPEDYKPTLYYIAADKN